MSKKVSISVGIPTYEAGASLVKTLQSIYTQTAFSEIDEVIVMCDGNEVVASVREKIKHPKLRLIVKKDRKGQAARINDLCAEAASDLLILTNDDVILDTNVVSAFRDSYLSTHADLLSGKAVPLPSKKLLHQFFSVGYNVTHFVISDLKKDSYLSCNGRLIALSKKLYKKIQIPETIWNNDAYVYLFAKIYGFGYAHVPHAIVRFQSPSTITEHSKQSQKFQVSQAENQHFFDNDISSYYRVGGSVMIKALINSFVKQPLLTIGYVGVLVYTRCMPRSAAVHAKGFWQTDATTKELSEGDK